MKYLLFSHGFGVKKDSRGMFTEIAESFPEYQPVMFDYNIVNDEINEVTVEPYSKQALTLENQITNILEKDKEADITLICHSQGCVVPCLVNGLDVSKAVLLAPPKILGSNMSRNQNVSKGSDGSIRIPRKDGTITIVTSDFIAELDKTVPVELYNRLSRNIETTIVVAGQDEILKDVDFSELADKIQIIKIDGDHNFTGENRKGLIETLSKILN